jgi:hypothetical protein
MPSDGHQDSRTAVATPCCVCCLSPAPEPRPCSRQDPRAAQRAKRRRLLTDALSARIRRGLIRYLEVIVDLSRASATTDFRPTRFAVVLGVEHAAMGFCMFFCCTHRTCQPLAAGYTQQCA